MISSESESQAAEQDEVITMDSSSVRRTLAQQRPLNKKTRKSKFCSQSLERLDELGQVFDDEEEFDGDRQNNLETSKQKELKSEGINSLCFQ